MKLLIKLFGGLIGAIVVVLVAAATFMEKEFTEASDKAYKQSSAAVFNRIEIATQARKYCE